MVGRILANPTRRSYHESWSARLGWVPKHVPSFQDQRASKDTRFAVSSDWWFVFSIQMPFPCGTFPSIEFPFDWRPVPVQRRSIRVGSIRDLWDRCGGGISNPFRHLLRRASCAFAELPVASRFCPDCWRCPTHLLHEKGWGKRT